MPWKATSAVNQRVEMMLEWKRQSERSEVNMAALCREFGVSRRVAYKWLRRFKASDFSLTALFDQSRRPKSSPTKVSAAIESLVVTARQKHPAWGPKKLLGWMRWKYPRYASRLPSAGAIARILARHGLQERRVKARRRTPPYTQPFAECTAPNMVWCADFKGWFRSADGKKIYPLTITDAFSRFIIRCVPLTEPDGDEAKRVFKSAFRQYGMPHAIRTDNGAPFATTAVAGLGVLNVWWIRLGINHERIDKGKPQQNGRHERMHRTLEAERGRAWRKLAAQQLSDQMRNWVKEFNYERPHEALKNERPADHYAPSTRRYPVAPETANNRSFRCEIADEYGDVIIERTRVHLAPALVGERIELFPYDGGNAWLICWRGISLGIFDKKRPRDRLFSVPGRRPSKPKQSFGARRPQANIYVMKEERKRKTKRRGASPPATPRWQNGE